MIIRFEKYQGAGNDFIIVQERDIAFPLSRKQISFLCDRRFGIGADGLMIIKNSDRYDFEMNYYNSDGLEGTMCGNGGRCIALFANKHKIAGKDIVFMAIDGEHTAQIVDDQIILSMNDVSEIYKYNDGYFLNTGSPHFIKFVKNIENIDVFSEGLEISNDKRFAPERTNVNFIDFFDSQTRIATFERGVENETLACGTGTVAAAITIHFAKKSNKNTIDILAKGGKLAVSFDLSEKTYTNIKLKGPAAFVFKGDVEI